MSQSRYTSRGPLAGIIGIVVLIGIIWLIFKMVSGIFSLLSILAPILFIIALILNRFVVIDYAKWLWGTIQKDTPRGLIYGALSVIGFPVLSAYFFLRAFMSSRLKKVVDQKRKESREDKAYDDYEEVDEDDFLELPDLADTPQKETLKKDSGYEDLFE